MTYLLFLTSEASLGNGNIDSAGNLDFIGCIEVSQLSLGDAVKGFFLSSDSFSVSSLSILCQNHAERCLPSQEVDKPGGPKRLANPLLKAARRKGEWRLK